MKVGLFFGTFNPIHTGHLIIANYLACNTDLKQVWFVVSPQNPFKIKESLLSDNHRLQMVKLAIDDNDKLRVCNDEFKLPKPSYTITTLLHLKEKHPTKSFVLIMGEDNLRSFHKWKNFEKIAEMVEIYVYPRNFLPEEIGTELVKHAIPKHKLFDVPTLNLSASFVRNCIKNKQSIKYLVPEKVENYLEEMHFYKE